MPLSDARVPAHRIHRITIRSHRIGDMGHVVARHGVLYHREYGFDISFEAMVARIAADFIDGFEPSRFCSRIAELDGAIAGAAFVVPGLDAPSVAHQQPTLDVAPSVAHQQPALNLPPSVARPQPAGCCAKLRLVYLEPEARGLGIGRRLVEECMAFARQAGYRRMTLSTHDILLPARRLYASLGFRCVATVPFRGFGRDMADETWERDL